MKRLNRLPFGTLVTLECLLLGPYLGTGLITVGILPAGNHGLGFVIWSFSGVVAGLVAGIVLSISLKNTRPNWLPITLGVAVLLLVIAQPWVLDSVWQMTRSYLRSGVP